MLDDNRLASNHVGRTVEQQRTRHASRQRAVDLLILIIESVLHHHLRSHRAGRFVDVVIERDMRVGIDDARRQVFSLRVDHAGVGGRIDRFADRGNLSILDVDRAVLDVAVRNGHDDRILDHDVVRNRWRRRLRENNR